MRTLDAGWQLCEALWTSRLHDLESFVGIESRYNLLDRSIERELVLCCQAYGIGVVPWGPLAGGFLTGRYLPGQEIPADVHLSNFPSLYGDVPTDANFDRLAKLEAFAKELGHRVGGLPVAWLLSHAWVGSVIAGATSMQQLSANVIAAGWRLAREDIDRSEEIL
ncbi:MAG: aldo/keto reductase [Deltaproteobacteria bacterium]|nr:MAG: aldo/keto reductase [Deltaproteobacteria bacterium]